MVTCARGALLSLSVLALGCEAGVDVLDFDVDPTCEAPAWCAAPLPVRLVAADLDGDGRIELATVGLGLALTVIQIEDAGVELLERDVQVELAPELRACDLEAGMSLLLDNDIEYRLYRVTADDINLVAREPAPGRLRCVRFAAGEPERIVFVEESQIHIDDQSFSFEPVYGPDDFVVIPAGTYDRFFLLASDGLIRIVDVDRSSGVTLAEQTWELATGEAAPTALAQADVDPNTPGAELIVAVATLPSGSQVRIFSGAQTGAPQGFASSTVAIPFWSDRMIAGQLDADPQAELVIEAELPTELARVDVVDGEPEVELLEAGGSVVDVAMGDVDGDGVQEILLLDATVEQVRVLEPGL